MELTGRITADAQVTNLKDDRKVVNFSIAINDSFRRKGDSENTTVTTYFNCAYWKGTAVAGFLKKGKLVQIYGRVGMNVYNNTNGEAKGSLTFHVNELKLIGGIYGNTDATPTPTTGEEKDDLPF